jgi:hypothetical protein
MPSAEGAGSEGGGDTLEGLDQQLDESLEDFDASVMGEGGNAGEEMTDILDPLSNSAGTESDAPLFEEADLGEAGDSNENASIAERAAEGAAGGGGEPATSGQQASAGGGGQDGDDSADIIPIPDDVGDGRNDDIVLRQIRDAAMKEHDETLREKLWDEYRRIKGQ